MTRLFHRTQRSPASSVFRVVAAENIHIPPNHEMVINGYLNAAGIDSTTEFLFEPTLDFCEKHDVLSSPSISYSQDSCIPIRLINPHNEPLTIYHNTNLGTADPKYDLDNVLRSTSATLDKHHQKEFRQLLNDFKDIFFSFGMGHREM